MPRTQVAVERVDIGGVPVFWVDSGEPELSAELVFRVGQVDEQLWFRGVTHLAEHLALSTLDGARVHYNGGTSLFETSFAATGEPDAMARFLDGVCANLRALPAQHLERERQLLRAEAEQRPQSMLTELCVVRYGAAGYGLLGFRELGLEWLDATAVQGWVDQGFTAGNAALVLSGPPPAGLRLDLGDGPLHPVPAPAPLPRHYPAFVQVDSRLLAVDLVLPYSRVSSLAADVLRRRLNRVLRVENGVTYSVDASMVALDHDTVHAMLVADVLSGHDAHARDLVVRALENLTLLGPTEEEFAEARDDYLRELRLRPPVELARRAARQHLLGQPPPRDLDEAIAEVSALGRAEVHAALNAALDKALYAVPPTIDLPPPVLPVSRTASARVTGPELRPLDPSRTDALVFGADGLTHSGDVYWHTALASDAAAVLCWGDDSRVVVTREGDSIAVRRNEWPRIEHVATWIDVTFGATGRVPMPGSGALEATAPDLPPPVAEPQPSRWVEPAGTPYRLAFAQAQWLVLALAIAAAVAVALVDDSNDRVWNAARAFVATFAVGYAVARTALTRRSGPRSRGTR